MDDSLTNTNSSEGPPYDNYTVESESDMRHQQVLSFLNGFKNEADNSDLDYPDNGHHMQDDMAGYDSRRPVQTASEKKRRDMIKTGYDKLAQMCLRSCNQPETTKLSHANILTRTSNYIDSLEYDIKALREEKKQIEMQLVAVGMMKQAYSVMSNKNDSPRSVTQVQAFSVFREVMDRLYDSFRQFVCMDSFPQLAQTLLKWAELHCSPNYLHTFAETSLLRIRAGLSLFRST